jgi:hypothetical protein
MEKSFEYAAKINSQIMDMLNDEDSSNHIDIDEFENGENVKAFLHALSTMVPVRIYNKYCHADLNNLEWNHLANSLVFENSKLEK